LSASLEPLKKSTEKGMKCDFPTGVLEWLLDSDPAIRWQVMRDLTGAPEEQVTAERAKVATEGWGARLRVVL
jgi:hypothetical protein